MGQSAAHSVRYHSNVPEFGLLSPPIFTQYLVLQPRVALRRRDKRVKIKPCSCETDAYMAEFGWLSSQLVFAIRSSIISSFVTCSPSQDKKMRVEHALSHFHAKLMLKKSPGFCLLFFFLFFLFFLRCLFFISSSIREKDTRGQD